MKGVIRIQGREGLERCPRDRRLRGTSAVQPFRSESYCFDLVHSPCRWLGAAAKRDC